MSKVRHDAAWWSTNKENETLLVVFGNSSKFARDKLILPQLAREIYDYNLSYLK